MLLSMHNQLMGGVNSFFSPLITQEPTQSPKTPESKYFSNHEVPQTHHEILQYTSQVVSTIQNSQKKFISELMSFQNTIEKTIEVLLCGLIKWKPFFNRTRQ